MKQRIELEIGYVTGDLFGDVALGDARVSRTIELDAPGADGQPGLRMTIDSSSGVPRCTRIEVASVEGGREVRSTDLRAVHIDHLIEAIVPLFTVPVERQADGSISGVIRVPDSDSDHFKQARKLLREARKESRRTITPDLLRAVAAIYVGNPDQPAQAVRLAFGVSPRTAHRYIAAAREENFIPARTA